MKLVQIIGEIKKKKELAGISDSVVENILSDYLEKYGLNSDKLSKGGIKIIIKEVRANLRNLVGRFQRKPEKRGYLLCSQNFQELLSTHSSTAERLDFYDELKKIIKNTRAKSILDLGCGLNPLALASPETAYYASDINEHELRIIEDFFRQKNIKGETFVCDLKKMDKILPKADLCLLFKVLDVVDPAGKNRGKITKKILSEAHCRKFLVSFSTKKLSGKKMNFPRREWFERMLKKLKMSFSTFESSNEFFYLIENPNFRS